MTDIAILVAEEFERRVSLSTRANKEDIGFDSCVSFMAKFLKKIKIGEEREDKINMGFVTLVGEPKTQISLAALNGFFSA